MESPLWQKTTIEQTTLGKNEQRSLNLFNFPVDCNLPSLSANSRITITHPTKPEGYVGPYLCEHRVSVSSGSYIAVMVKNISVSILCDCLRT